MGLSIWLYPFLTLILMQFQTTFCSTQPSFSSSPPPLDNQFKCSYEESLALLEFSQHFTINTSSDRPFDSDYYYNCEYYRFPKAKTMSWNMSVDCCKWEGVTCDEFTGTVIGLNLSCSYLQGTIHSNSTLFQLSHLKTLNLASNDFYPSTISHKFGQFQSLAYLDLSSSNFIGTIPSEISHLSNLLSLDLSSSDQHLLKFEANNFEMLLQNITRLEQVSLFNVDLSSIVFNANISLSSLTSLDLSQTGLHKSFLNKLHLPNLQKLRLAFNPSLSGPFPLSILNLTNLVSLDLSANSLSGTIPYSIGNLIQLSQLHLSSNSLSGPIPSTIGNLTQLEDILITGNYLSGPIPSTIGNLTQLERLILPSNSLSGPIPSSLGHLTQLEHLILSFNSLSGPIPSSLGHLTQLEDLQLSHNSLSGPIPSTIGNLTQLRLLILFSNSLSGPIPSTIGDLTQLEAIEITHNSLSGPIPTTIGNLIQLEDLVLSNNSLSGPIPCTLANLTQLGFLRLGQNNLRGSLPSNAISLQKLQLLDLSSNSLNGTIPSWLFACPSLYSLKLQSNKFTGLLEEFRNNSLLSVISFGSNQLHGHIPHSLSASINLRVLDLSRNNFTGIIDLHRFSNLSYLSVLDLSFNNLTVRSSSNTFNATLPNLQVLSLSSCKLNEFPFTNICDFTNLEVLDLSRNNLSGEVLPCLGNFSDELSVLNLQNNNFHGTIPSTFIKGNSFRNINFNGNQLSGNLPRSLANCEKLEVLDIGNNFLNDTFPIWLGTLPELQVLVLRSNRFYGFIPESAKSESPWIKLRIIDLSNNEFSGLIPSEYFTNFKAMMHVHENIKKPEYMGDSYYEDSVTLVTKGIVLHLERILTVFTTIDMSNNKFCGNISNFIGNLSSLRGLNLSRNQFVGHIPSSLGKLFVLESLDLSFNQLEGEIPQQLADLKSLAVLNLSQNHLIGRIPRGMQFNTFENSSYSGNLALCGFPVSKDCGSGDETQNQLPPPKHEENEDESYFKSGITWIVVSLGYVCGTIIGLAMGYLMFSTGKPRWLVQAVEKYEYKNGKKRSHRRRTRRHN